MRGNKPKRRESEEGGWEGRGWGVGRDAGLGEPQKARVKGFRVLEGDGNPWWSVYW